MTDKMIALTKRIIRKLMPMEYIFTRVYRTHRFGGKKSASGPGSDLAQTEAIRQALPALIKEFNIKTMLDAPCGDFYWMRNTRLDIKKYIGVDIVAEITRQNSNKYGGKNIEFRKLNIVKDKLPKTDMILCRDCLVHFSSKDIFATVKNFKRSGSTYLFATTFTQHFSNVDILTGGWRPLNLQSPPFNFPNPIKLIYESCTEEGDKYRDKCLGLWEIKDIMK
jgi:hypothetical protein